MGLEKNLRHRAEDKCELCGVREALSPYKVEPSDGTVHQCVLVCKTCAVQMDSPATADENHWHCLNDSMWSQIPAVQVAAWRMLKHLGRQEALDMLYLDEESQAWANAGFIDIDAPKHIDSNGVELRKGDTVVLTKDLDVKGSSVNAKRGTAVRGVSLDPNNHEYIEGKIAGQRIVILTKFVKKL